MVRWRVLLAAVVMGAGLWADVAGGQQLTGAEAPRHPELPPPPDCDEPNVEVMTFSIPGSGEKNISRAIVVVPSDYGRLGEPATRTAATDKRYPVVYLLHGYSGNYTNWYLKMKAAGRSLTALADRFGTIIVMPDGKYCSWYLDAPTGSEDHADWQWETVITKHLVPEVDRRYRTWAEPAGRGITGLSMGGHGAIYLAARNPDLFSACGSMSGVMDLTNTSRPDALVRRLGPKEENRDRWLAYSAIGQEAVGGRSSTERAGEPASPTAGRGLGLLVDCGIDDIFIEDNRVFRKQLLERGIPHDYIERPGAHNWDYWINALPYHMQFLSDRLKPAGSPERAGAMPAFRPVVVADKLPDDPYGLDVADINGDGRLDLVLTRFFGIDWYEAPHWQRHPIVTDATRQNIAGVARDIDGDGVLDVAIAADWEFTDTVSDGTLWWAKGGTGQTPWPLTRIGGEPNLHRVLWADTHGDGRGQLLVSPLKGRGTTSPHFAERGVRLLLFDIPDDPAAQPWPTKVIDASLHVCHAAIPVRFDDDPADEVLAASFEGVTLFDRQADGSWHKRHLGAGDQQSSPDRGSSEVSLGRLKDGRRIVAAIEPWHGNQVVVYVEPSGGDSGGLWPRFVLDDTFDQGHAVVCADLDGDGNDEIVAGYRGPNRRNRGRPTSLKAYQVIDADASRWSTHWIDDGDMATEALQIVDLDGDGRLDIVAAGRSTRNLKVYFNQGRR